MAPTPQSPGAGERRAGHLVIIGGNEDRDNDKQVLRRFVELTARADPKIVVLCAAGATGDTAWKVYDQAFADLGVQQRLALEMASREDANDPKAADRLLTADGIFIAGDDQKRLLAVIGGTLVHQALHKACDELGRCIAGTSAGAAALSQHMMHDGGAGAPAPGTALSLAAGLGLLQRVLIDQHFSERQRLGRLLSVVAQNPTLIGVGIDEDTALVIERSGGGLEVVGDGAVTLIDGRQMSSNFLPGPEHEALELVDVKLHLLPAGARYGSAAKAVPPALQDIVSILTSRGSPLS
ncbi:cyanophycinase [Ideonella sp. BN130291]|uniref:cyanophycinase n=1 Tax=Ideonella sp. BN130291 TaxID=3112940 RepID=UPI002E2629EB|nr:cyanophycinase [Ideonella sp. BN130291]